MFKFCPYCGYKIENPQKSDFQCLNCKKWTHYNSPNAVTVALKVGNEGLVAVRGREPGKGLHDLVGGFLGYGEDPIKAAVREFKEEAKIEIEESRLKFLGFWVDTYLYQEEDQLLLNIAYLLELPEKPDVKAADDVAELVWMPLNQEPNFAFPYLHQVWKKLKE